MTKIVKLRVFFTLYKRRKWTLNKMSQTFTVTGYCPCEKCCGKTDGKTASGKKATANHTIAAPSKYAFGTKFVLDGYGTFYVEDRGGAIKNNRLDRYFDTHQEALNWGKKTCTGTVYSS